MELLKLENISKSFLEIHALKNFNFDLQKGEVHALVGENGAGKSTLMKIISGVIQKDEGNIWLNGKLVNLKSPIEAKNNGINIIHQEVMLIPKINVVENIFLGEEKSFLGIIKKGDLYKRYKTLSDEVGIYLPPNTLVEDLNYAQQQLVQILKALSAKANIIIMDEPTASLTSDESKYLFNWINNQAKNRNSYQSRFCNRKNYFKKNLPDITPIYHSRLI